MKQDWWGFSETLRLIFRDISVHEVYLENDALLAKLWKVSNIFVTTVLHCVWRVFLGNGPSSTWIAFQERLNFLGYRGRKWIKQNLQKVKKGGLWDYFLQTSCTLGLALLNKLPQECWEGQSWRQVTWSNLRGLTSVQAQVSKLKCPRSSQGPT